ncbi:MAG: hypothetical protein ACRCYS_07825 [Beijerinckiaceae bacterium]
MSQTAQIIARLRALENAPAGPGGGGGSWETVTVDFGASYTDGAEFTIADASVSPASTVAAQFSGADSTVDNTAEDHQFAAMFMRLATIPAAGSFKLQAQAMAGLISRTMKVRYQVA